MIIGKMVCQIFLWGVCRMSIYLFLRVVYIYIYIGVCYERKKYYITVWKKREIELEKKQIKRKIIITHLITGFCFNPLST